MTAVVSLLTVLAIALVIGWLITRRAAQLCRALARPATGVDTTSGPGTDGVPEDVQPGPCDCALADSGRGHRGSERTARWTTVPTGVRGTAPDRVDGLSWYPQARAGATSATR